MTYNLYFTRLRPYLRSLALPAGLMVGLGIAPPAQAAETVTYSYDALGRLTGDSRSGGTNDGMATAIQYDAAGNRTNVTVTGSQNMGLVRSVIVIPLMGFLVIPLTNN